MFFKSYYNAGPGVDKNTPEKKGFARYWELLTIDFWGFIGLNMLYALISLPVLTLGGATLSYNHLCCKLLRKEHVFIWSDFWEQLKGNFKKGILLGFLYLFIIFDLLILYTNALTYLESGIQMQSIIVWSLALAMSLFITTFTAYLTAGFANLDIDFLSQIKNAFLLMLVGGWRSLAAGLFQIALFIVGFTYFPFSTVGFFVFGLYLLHFTTLFFIWPVIQKHAVSTENPEVVTQ